MRLSRRDLGRLSGAALLAQTAQPSAPATQVFPGVWKVRIGQPEKITPVATRSRPANRAALAKLAVVTACPVEVTGSVSKRGCLVSIPLEPNELVYGLGLQLKSFLQRGLKKKLRVNADPQMDSGDSHAPVPFYVTTRGYGVLVDTARYATFYCGNKVRKGQKSGAAQDGTQVQNGLPSAYGRFRVGERSDVLVEVPEAAGVDVYVFGGPAMREAVQRYNLFSGGGCLPPQWGLGFWYRCFGEFGQSEVAAMGQAMRASGIPCDVLGLEPGWQSHAYSCSFVWSGKFPQPERMVQTLAVQGFQVNLWEHAFTHPSSPLHAPLQKLSGDYTVWDGLVPDFLLPEARHTFGAFHQKEHVALGVSGYKLDECDNSDFTRNWSFPEISSFPSGADGEQMHSLFGREYQEAILAVFENQQKKTYGLVRSSGALAAPYPFVLYSDLYDHSDFVRGLVNSGFSGLLWCPEVRDALNREDLLRRLQTVVFSPLAMVNAWYIRNPPWKQVDRAKNNAGQFAEGWQDLEAECRRWIELRMQLVPYLYTAFTRYRDEGLPPFRALVMDYPDDPKVWTIDDQYLMGESLLIAPVVAGQKQREVYLPAGDWFAFRTGKRFEGAKRYTLDTPLDNFPAFVKGGTLLPLAEVAQHAGDPAAGKLSVEMYGSPGAPITVSAEDGRQVTLRWDRTLSGRGYEVVRWISRGG